MTTYVYTEIRKCHPLHMKDAMCYCCLCPQFLHLRFYILYFWVRVHAILVIILIQTMVISTNFNNKFSTEFSLIIKGYVTLPPIKRHKQNSQIVFIWSHPWSHLYLITLVLSTLYKRVASRVKALRMILKFPGSNLTRRSARLKDPTSLRGSRWTWGLSWRQLAFQ